MRIPKGSLIVETANSKASLERLYSCITDSVTNIKHAYLLCEPVMFTGRVILHTRNKIITEFNMNLVAGVNSLILVAEGRTEIDADHITSCIHENEKEMENSVWLYIVEKDAWGDTVPVGLEDTNSITESCKRKTFAECNELFSKPTNR